MNHIKLLTYIPAIYFALLGAFDIGMDIWHGTLTPFQTFFNIAFFIPLIFRNRHVFAVLGILFTGLWAYLLMGGLYLLSAGKADHIGTLEKAGVSLFLIFSLLCSVAMMYIGAQQYNKRKVAV